MGQYLQHINAIKNEVKKVVIGKDDVIDMIMTAIIAKGHILLEDIPGVGKTTMALAFSKAMALSVNRMQFTPDVLPSDVVGFNMINKAGEYEYKSGAVVCNLFLADEINRTSPKTQSALLEVMEEGKISVDGVTRVLCPPFTVIATQNPSGSAGTQLLPESQLDRFMIKLSVGYPDLQSEMMMLKSKQNRNAMLMVRKIITREDLLKIQEDVEKVFVSDEVFKYVAEIALKTRNNKYIKLGLSPRGTIALLAMAKSYAYCSNRDFVIPEDVRKVALGVMGHRLILNTKARVEKVLVKDVVKNILSEVSSPEVFNR